MTIEGKQNREWYSLLASYLSTAAGFRTHEFNIQFIRYAVFTGTQAVFLACYSASIEKVPLASGVIAVFGATLTVLSWQYYCASLYWSEYWEQRCKEINDHLITATDLPVDLFAGHLVVKDGESIVPIAGMKVKPKAVYKTLKNVQIMFGVLWVALIVTAWFLAAELARPCPV